MGLYLCIFDGDDEEGDDELEGVAIGHYSDFALLRDSVRDHLEDGDAGSRFPVLMNHEDNDGEWSPSEAKLLDAELVIIANEFAARPPIALSGWQAIHVKENGLTPKTLLECFFEVGGAPLLARMRELCACSIERGLPILFQ